MTFLFLRKFLSLLLSVLLSGIVPVFASQVDDIVASARPDRSTSLSYRGSKNNSLSFKEYYLSGEGNNCSFHGFGVNREDGIRSIYEKAFGKNPSNTLKDLLSKSIAFEIENREREFAIFGIDLNRVRLDTKSEEIQKQYLNHYKNCTDLIECAVNFDADGKPLEKTNYSLLNALAYA